MHTLILRDATKTDASAIAALWNHYIRDTDITFTSTEKTADDIADLLSARPGFWVACHADHVLGFASYGAFRSGPGYARTAEHTVLLAAEAQGQGVGRRLMDQVMRHAAAHGIHGMVAGISGANTGAIRFHEALEFQSVGHVPAAGFKFGRSLDLHLMHRFV